MYKKVIFLISLLLMSGLTAAQTQDSYITLHALNPEGVELGSISLNDPDEPTWITGEPALIIIDEGYVTISPTHEIEDFDDEYYNQFTHNWPIPISAGTHTIRAWFNGMEKQQVITLGPGETRAVTFVFERTEFDLANWIDERDFPRTIERDTPDGVYVSTEGYPPPTELFDSWFVQNFFDGWPGEFTLFTSDWPDGEAYYLIDSGGDSTSPLRCNGIWANESIAWASFHIWYHTSIEGGYALILCPWVTAGDSWWDNEPWESPPVAVYKGTIYDLKMSSVPYDLLGTGINCGGGGGGEEPPPESQPQVIVWTGGDGQDGHFIPEHEGWWLGENANLPIHVVVAILNDGVQQPVEGATIFLEDVPYGQTDSDGHLRFLFPIYLALPPGPFTRTVEAQWDGGSVLSDEIELYRSELLESIPPITMTSMLKRNYELKHIEKFQSVPPPPELEWVNLLRLLAFQVFGMNYHPQVGDVINFGAYKFTASDVQPVWLVHERVERDGQIALVFNAWTENEAKYNWAIMNFMNYALADEAITIALASPATLCVTAPDGSRAGYDPDTGGLLLEFPAAIDDPGDEPFVLSIPNPEIGEYLIHVIPDPDASPTETYSLEVTSGDTTIVLAENVAIGSVPENPYVIRVTETGIDQTVSACIDLDPDTINLSSAGRWVTCYIELPEGLDVSLIDGGMVEMEGIPAYIGKEGWAKAESNHWNITDNDENGIPERMVKFDSFLVQLLLVPGDVTLSVYGGLIDGTIFEGEDSIKVINPRTK